MTGLATVVVVGALILVLGVRLLVQSLNRRQHPVTSVDYVKAREALNLVFVEMAAVKRIFAPDDMQFIALVSKPDVQRLFLKERKELALSWLRTIRKQVVQLMDLHLRLASYTYNPSPKLEIKLTLQYWRFMALSSTVQFLVWLCGPFKANSTIAYLIQSAGNFCTIFGFRLEGINPARLSSIRESLVH